ncbi:MAG: chemotaxis protein CheY [Nocardioides sp.]|nr:chemotaxis protein CheY [Nocardioides sp.]
MPRVTETGVLRIVIADDHPLYLQALVSIFSGHPEFEVVFAASDGAAAVAAVREHAPDIALVDLQLPTMDGIEIVTTLERAGLPTRVVIVSAYEDSATVYRAFAAGAKAYLPKSSSGETVRETVLSVAAGETVIPSALQSGLAGEIRSRSEREAEPPAKARLTAREYDVLRLTAEGYSAPEVAEQLFVGVTTVKTHLQHVYEKLGVSDRAAAVAVAHRTGLLS